MEIVNSRIENYLDRALTVKDPILREMQRHGESRDFPVVGAQVGRLLNLLARSIGATRVLELGSGFGYSALWFAHAVGPQGRVVLTDLSKENIAQAQEYFRRAKMLNRAQFEVGNALEIIERIPGSVDVVFNDLDKRQYPLTLDLVRPKLRVGGLFISDNMLWGGSVLSAARSADARGIKELTRQLLDAPDFKTTILPVRDGVAVALKVR